MRAWIAIMRPSNLPTVWTNVLAGAVIASGGEVRAVALGLLALAGSVLYSAGMILNDAFDREIDRVERPERPIPSGKISAAAAFLAGFFGLLLGIVLAGIAAVEGATTTAIAAALALSAAIVVYDLKHKKNPVAPYVMGLCRALLYVLAAVAANRDAVFALERVAPVAFALFAWVVSLTYVARAETAGRVPFQALLLLAVPFFVGATRWNIGLPIFIALLILAMWTGRSIKLAQTGKIGPAIVSLIAGISLVDAVALAGIGAPRLALLAALGTPLTVVLQRWVRGT